MGTLLAVTELPHRHHQAHRRHTILGALVGALPGKMPATNSGTLLVMAFGGRDPDTGRRFMASELAAGGMGARPDKDGIDGIETDVSSWMTVRYPGVASNGTAPPTIPRPRARGSVAVQAHLRKSCASPRFIRAAHPTAR